MEQVKVNHKDFWHIRMGAKSLIWHFAMQALLKSQEIKAWNDWIQTNDDDGNHIYLVSKERYDAASVAKHFGITEEKLQAIEMLVLDEPDEGELPKPTVDYYGEA